jgi:hypothetical protein
MPKNRILCTVYKDPLFCDYNHALSLTSFACLSQPGLPEGCAELDGAERNCTGSGTHQRWTGVIRRSEGRVLGTYTRPTEAEHNRTAAVRLVYVLMEVGLGLSSCAVPLLTPWPLFQRRTDVTEVRAGVRITGGGPKD